MDSNKRLILTVVLSIAILLGFQLLSERLYPPPPPSAEAPTAPTPTGEPAPAPTPAPAPSEVAPAEPAAPAQPERLVELRTPDSVLTFTNRGPGIVSAELLGEKNRRPRTDEPVDLAGDLTPQDPPLFSVRTAGGLPELPPRAACTETARTESTISFRCESGPLVVEEEYRVGHPAGRLSVTLRNNGAEALQGTVSLLAPARVDPARQRGNVGCTNPFGQLPMPTNAICRHGDDVTRRMFDPDERIVRPEGRASWAGIDERYFLAVAVPLGGNPQCVLETPSPELVQASLVQPTGPIPPGGSVTLRFATVIGQKQLSDLNDLSGQLATEEAIADPELGSSVDLGLWAVIARMLLWLLKIFHALIPNWGVAIILLTLTVKLLTFPLAWKSMKSMEEMRKLAPEIEELKKKYGADREKLNLEMLQLYQKHKVNPMGGCLPMLIQMPIWIALYTTLQTSVELYNEPFIAGWLDDLTAKDPYYILPLAMGLTMFATQKMQPATSMDPMQQKMMQYFMPTIFTLFMLQLPSGLTLYIFTNNILSIVQQLALRKSMGMPLVGAPTPAAAATVEATKVEKTKGKKGK